MSIDTIVGRIATIQAKISGADAITPTQQDATTADSTTSSSFADTLSSAIGLLGGSSSTSLTSLLGSATSSGLTGNSVVQDAQQYLGVPYKWGGTDPSTGLDCSGLVQKVYGDLGINLPRVAADQAKQGTPVASLAQAQPGDLVAFDTPVDHIGIYIGNNQMIVAPKTGDVVKVENVYKTPSAIRRIIPNSSAVSDSISNPGSTGSIGGSLQSSYTSLFQQAAAKYGLSPSLLAAVAKQESGFNANAVSGAGAQGLMQLMPSTAKGLGVNPLNASQAIDGAARMLSGLIKQFGSTSLALAAYNAGPGAVQKYGGIPPYAETQNYVRNVLSLAQQGAAS